jgi:hypothetical protein
MGLQGSLSNGSHFAAPERISSMTALSSSHRWWRATMLLVGVTTATGFVSGCGGTAGNSQSSPASASPKISQAIAPTIVIPGDANGPVNVQIAIDRTPILAGGALATDYATAADNAAELAVARGGTLTISAFGRVGARPLTVFQATMPPLSQEGQAVRGGDEAAWRSNIDAAVSVAVGLAKATPTVAGELAALTDGTGSDVARALAYQLSTQPDDQTTPDVIEIITNGLVNEHTLHLVAGISNGKPTGDLAARISREASIPSGTRRATLVRIGPVGLTSGQAQLGPLQTRKLIASWTLALRSFPIEEIQIGATI